MSTKHRRSRNGCQECKRSRTRCDETKPACLNCIHKGTECAYTLTLHWGGRPRKSQPGDEQYTPETYRKRHLKKLTKPEAKAIKLDTSPTIQRVVSNVGTSTANNPLAKRSISSGMVASELISSLGYNPRFETSQSQPSLNHLAHIGNNGFQASSGSVDLISLPLRNQLYEGVDEKRQICKRDGEKFATSPFEAMTPSEVSTNVFPVALNLQPLSNSSPALSDSSKALDFNFFGVDWTTTVSATSALVMNSPITTTAPQTAEEFLSNFSEDIARTTDFDEEIDSNYTSYAASQSSIPPSLMPWPELILNVAYYRKLLHFWVTEGCTHLVPAPWASLQQNPFQVLLPRMAMEYPLVMTIMLAFAAKVRSQLLGYQDLPPDIRDQLLSRSCTELIRLLSEKDTSTSDCTLATILLMSSYEAFDSKDMDRHRAHARGARKVINARLKKIGRKMSEISYFLMRWFVYIDVVGGLLTTKHHHKYIRDQEEYEPAELLRAYRHGIDDLTGMEVNLYPQFARISYLLRETETFIAETGYDAVPVEVISESFEVERKIEEIVKGTILGEPILCVTNKLFCYMGLINLYRRALKLPRQHPKVQKLVHNSYLIYRNDIEPRLPADLCTVSCAFTIGCECVDPIHRQLFDSRMRLLGDVGNVNAIKSHSVMKRCWETGEDKMAAAEVLDIDVTPL